MIKRAFDLISSLSLLVLFLPFFFIISALIKLETSGPVFFIQDRLGKHGKLFKMIKFRTMIVNAEEMDEGLFSYSDDPRITKVGKYLRMLSLDETPQILNVILGSMSLVGPRPPVSYELGDYRDFTEHMRIRFQVKPGITGLAQVSGRNNLNWDKKIEFDNRYVHDFEKFGVIEDIKILFKTIFIVLSMGNTIEKKPEELK